MQVHFLGTCPIIIVAVLEFSTTRLQLAALHFNENSSRDQALTKEGKERYNILFPKFKKGGYIVRKVTVEPTYSKLCMSQDGESSICNCEFCNINY